LSKLSAWWVRLGILPELIEPGRPDQNGRQERMHRTLKAETTRPAAGSLAAQQRQQLLATPARMSPSGVEDRAHDLLGGLIRRAPRPPRGLLQAGRAVAHVAVDPFVAGLPRDAVERAQLGDRPYVAQVIGDELCPLVHG